MEKTDQFMQERLDTRRFVLLNMRKIWMICLGAAVGAFLFGILYYLKTEVLCGEALFRAQTLYAITFDRDQVDNIHDYYNDYTWNDILDSDRIAGRAAEKLGDVSKEEIALAASIPTMSDIRLIWVYVDMETKEEADRIEKAIGEALREFALQTDGFKEITVWDVGPTEQIKEHSLIGRMMIAGAVTGMLAACFFVWYGSAMDDSIYTEEDVTERFGVIPAGVIMKAGRGNAQPEYFYRELRDNLKKILEDKLTGDKALKIRIASLDPLCTVSLDQPGKYCGEILKKLRNRQDNITVSTAWDEDKMQEEMPDISIFLVPFGQKNGKRMELAWKNVKLQERLPDAVVIFDAEENFYRRYYKIGGRKGNNQ